MLKGLLTTELLLLLVLALQPAGAEFSIGNDLHSQALPVSSTVFVNACERTSGGDCAGADHCLHAGHAGCHLNLIKSAASVGFASRIEAAYLSPYGVPKLPLNETSPPLRPPQRS